MFRWLLLSQLLAAGLAATSAGAEPATITIHADQPGAAVPASLYGIFFEEINHAGDGGLYAELIQNRSFDETLPIEGCTVEGDQCLAPALPHYQTSNLKQWSHAWRFAAPIPAWSLVQPQAGDAAISVQTDRPLNANNPTYLRLVAKTGAAVRLLNEGYWGISVRSGERYQLAFFARAENSLQVRVGLLDDHEQVLAARELTVAAGGSWNRLTGEFAPSATCPKARFFLQPLTPGTLDLDFVSLFPQATFKNRPNGCRADLAQLLADLKPAFVRFPGGCVVEGCTMDNRWQWKKTIGPVHERPGHWSLWGYRNTDGLGYHEFLQLCEDLGAGGMLVINCGLSCEGRNGDFWPEDRIPELIQDALDACEYALGPADSKWGAVRARAGHPEPLPLRYVEIGNENHGPKYEALYPRFAAALKAAYPQLTLIADVHLDGSEMHDQHFYVAPPFFLQNYGRYDQAPRSDAAGRPMPRVYVGEFAVNREVGSGNLTAALSEAVFMLGMEKNSDLVTMCSYAPLFFNVNRLDWPVNMIGYDSAVAFGRTSYWAQRLFASHQPDVNLATEVASPRPFTLPPKAGLIGVGTWNTQAEFKDLRVTDKSGQTLFAWDPQPPYAGFQPVSGDWTLANGVLRQTSSEQPARAIAGDRRWSEYTLSLKARKLAGAEGFLIMFTTDERGKCWWNLGGWGNRQHGLEMGGEPIRVPGTIERDRWYDIRVELAGGVVKCFLDGQLVQQADRDPALPSLYAIAGQKRGSGELIVKAVNAAQEPQPVRFKVAGLAKLSPKATVVTLAHPDPTAENAVDAPTKIVPIESTVDNASPEFTYTLPANSVTVLRLTP